MAASANANEAKESEYSDAMNGAEATQLDVDLMKKDGEYQYEEPQLMELAGLSVASAMYDYLTNITKKQDDNKKNGNFGNCLVLCGPGNNGGDGLVCARHLQLFGLFNEIVVCYPRNPPKKQFYEQLLKQCESFDIKIEYNFDDITKEWIDKNGNAKYSVIVDSVFGYSFKTPLGGSWKNRIKAVSEYYNKYCKTIDMCSIDVPSGWDIKTGINGLKKEEYLQSDMLVSMSTPKECAKNYPNVHYLGGRFMPQKICEKFKVKLPKYPGCQQFVRIDDLSKM